MRCNRGSRCAVRALICDCKCANVLCAFGETLANPACLTNVARHHLANRSPRFGLSFMLSRHTLKSFIARGPLKRPTVVSITRLSCTEKHLSNNCTSSAANACARSVAKESAFGGTNDGAAVASLSSFFVVFFSEVVATPPFTETSNALTRSPSVRMSSSVSSSNSPFLLLLLLSLPSSSTSSSSSFVPLSPPRLFLFDLLTLFFPGGCCC